MIYGYARCSTDESKQDIERQKRELRLMGAEEIYFEYESGTKLSRPELNKLLCHIQPGDTLVTTEISRITRSVKQLCEIIELACQRGLKIDVGGLRIDCRGELDVMTEGMLKMMGVFAEMERKMTIERIKSGLRNARAKGVRLGRPKLSIHDIPQKVIDRFTAFKKGAINKTDYAKICGISRPTLNKYIAVMTDK